MIMDKETSVNVKNDSQTEPEEPQVIEEIIVEELSIDGICGVY
jgi:mycofactocin precursor